MTPETLLLSALWESARILVALLAYFALACGLYVAVVTLLRRVIRD